MRILLAEDERINQIYMKHMLGRAGHEVLVAGSGTEVLEMLRADSCDLVLMDVQMPEMDGLEATHRIRTGEVGVDRRDIPIVALTAFSSDDDRVEYREAGVTTTLTKPVDEAKLLEVIDTLTADR
ncbi:MAG: response regulator [Spirochaetota bacterium]